MKKIILFILIFIIINFYNISFAKTEINEEMMSRIKQRLYKRCFIELASVEQKDLKNIDKEDFKILFCNCYVETSYEIAIEDKNRFIEVLNIETKINLGMEINDQEKNIQKKYQKIFEEKVYFCLKKIEKYLK